MTARGEAHLYLQSYVYRTLYIAFSCLPTLLFDTHTYTHTQTPLCTFYDIPPHTIFFLMKGTSCHQLAPLCYAAYHKCVYILRFPPEFLLKYNLNVCINFIENKKNTQIWNTLSFATQNSTQIGERSVLILGSLCLFCSMRDTAWKRKNIYMKISTYSSN